MKKMIQTSTKLRLLTSLLLVLSSLTATSILAAAVQPGASTAPGGLYVGYYQEDPVTNPEDPTPGAFVLNLPEKDSTFDGNMYFTYVGCQSSNIGEVKGIKAGNGLNGTWSGQIDNSKQSGPYNGTYDPKLGSYKGVYANAGGKQFKKIEGCIEYYIAPNGYWEMFPVEQSQPASFNVSVAANKVSWPLLPEAVISLVYVIDPSFAQSHSGNPVKFQTILPPGVSSFNLSSLHLSKGKKYIVATLVNNNKSVRIAFSSKQFVAP